MAKGLGKIFGQIDLTKGGIVSNLLLFSLPFFVAYFLNSLYSAVDLFFISQFSDSLNVAAVSSGTTITFAVNSLILGIATGGTVIIGQYYGGRIMDGVKNATRNFFLLSMILAASLTVIMLAISYPIMDLLQVAPEARDIAKQYLIICSAGIPLFVAYASISALLRGLGNSFAPFVFVLIATVVNISLDALFIIVFKWGAVGAAIATVIGYGASSLSGFIFIKFIRKLPFEIEWKKGIQKKTVWRILRCGLPIAIQDTLVILSFAIILGCLSVRGVEYTAAVGVTDRVTSFCFVPLSAFATGISTATAQNMGAYEIKRVKQFVKWGLVFSSIIGLALTLFCVFMSRPLASIFSAGDEATLDLASRYIVSTVIDVMICSLVFPLNAAFIGSGHTVFAMGQNLGSTFAVRIPLALIFALAANLDIFYVGFAYPIATVFSLIACIIFYRSGKWMDLKKLALTEDLYDEFGLDKKKKD